MYLTATAHGGNWKQHNKQKLKVYGIFRRLMIMNDIMTISCLYPSAEVKNDIQAPWRRDVEISRTVYCCLVCFFSVFGDCSWFCFCENK